MTKTTKWRPDTCGCEIEYQWDDSLSQEARIHTVSNVVKKCDVHSTTPSKEDHYNKVLEENQRKNKVYGKLLEIPTATVDVTQPDGSTIKDLKSTVKFDWSFDVDRNLMVTLTGLNTSEKNSLKNSVNTLFGTRVTIK